MIVSRRSLLALSVTTLLPAITGCARLRTESNDDTESNANTEPNKDTKSNAAGGLGAADVHVHNLHDERVTVSIRAENVETDPSQEQSVPIDKTVALASGETHTIHNKVRHGSEYEVSVSLDDGYDEEATWTPDSGGGLHLLYDGSDNVVFADGFA